jgi:predicted permease
MLMSMKQVEIEGRPELEAMAGYRQASPGYFATMGIPIVQGREFTGEDNTNSPVVFVVNETFARKYFGTANPLGQRLRVRSVSADFGKVIGVLRDVKLTRLDGVPPPEVYVAQLQKSVWMFSVLARIHAGPGEVGRRIQSEVLALDPDLPAYNVRTLDSAVAASTAPLRFATSLMTGFGLLALVLAVVGLYGTLACGVSQRIREIGVRVALGAQSADIFGLVLRQGMKLTALGIVVGLLGDLALSRLIRGLLFGVEPADPLTFAVAPMLLVSVALVASWLPARRAARVDPMVALRTE